MKKSTDTLTLPRLTPTGLKNPKLNSRRSLPTLAWYGLAFFLCILVMATPLARLDGTTLQYALPTSRLLVLPGTWLPIKLGFLGNSRSAELSTHLLFFILLLALSFAIYCAAAYMLWHQKNPSHLQIHLRWILLIAFGCGLVFVLTPAMLSHDAFAYASYGRTMVIYHANPYFVPFFHFPQDSFYTRDDWRYTPSAYGPVWLAVSALFAQICGNQPLTSLLTYQFFGLALHLLNTYLVFLTLRALKQPSRIIALGTLLYAWNPLALLESCLSGHNDTLLITFLLLALYFSARIEEQLHTTRSFQIRAYLFPLIMLSLAILVKFSAAPMLVLFLILLARHSFLNSPSGSKLRLTFLRFCLASLFCASIILLFYAPFWLGWHLSDIIKSFTTTPAATSADGSILGALQGWVKVHGKPASGFNALFFSIFLQRSIWNNINIVVFGCTLLLAMLWLWRSPNTHTLALATLATLGILLLVTPWFFPWYVTWLIPLAAIGISAEKTPLNRAFIGSTLVFSASCCCIYFFKSGIPLLGGWIGFACLSTIVPPILAFLLIFRFSLPKKRASSLK
jgi:hypothetical protein